MLDEVEQKQGVVLRQIIVGANQAVRVAPYDRAGRINTFIVNESVAVYVKHSGARMPPWSFTFHQDHLTELAELLRKYPDSFVVLVCGSDGWPTRPRGSGLTHPR